MTDKQRERIAKAIRKFKARICCYFYGHMWHCNCCCGQHEGKHYSMVCACGHDLLCTRCLTYATDLGIWLKSDSEYGRCVDEERIAALSPDARLKPRSRDDRRAENAAKEVNATLAAFEKERLERYAEEIKLPDHLKRALQLLHQSGFSRKQIAHETGLHYLAVCRALGFSSLRRDDEKKRKQIPSKKIRPADKL